MDMEQTSETKPTNAVKLKKLTPKEQRFVEEYPIDFSASAAMRRAGYQSKKDGVLRTTAYRMLTKPSVQVALQERIQKLTENADDLTRRAIEETLRLSFSDIRKLFDKDGKLLPIQQIDDDTAHCISSIKVTERYEGRGESREFVGYEHEYKLWDKHPALDKLYRYLALYKDLGTKENPVHVVNAHINLSGLSPDELIRIRDNADAARALLVGRSN
jgi:phage terminase small subunit